MSERVICKSSTGESKNAETDGFYGYVKYLHFCSSSQTTNTTIIIISMYVEKILLARMNIEACTIGLNKCVLGSSSAG